jgi:hypothetical protein
MGKWGKRKIENVKVEYGKAENLTALGCPVSVWAGRKWENREIEK